MFYIIYIIQIFNLFKKKFNKSLIKLSKKKSIVLLEVYAYEASTITNSLFANIIAKNNNSEIVLYSATDLTLRGHIKKLLENIFFLTNLNLYKIFCSTSRMIYPKILKKISAPPQIYSKNKILNISINNIKIGDLIYDEFLRRNNIVTIDIKSKKFKDFLLYSYKLFNFWYKFLKKRKIAAVIASHSAYFFALPTRIAIHLNIPAYNVGPNFAYYLSKKKNSMMSDFENYKNIFNKNKSKNKKKFIEEAKNELHKRFLGKKDILHQTNQENESEVFLNNKIYVNTKGAKTILIATHCFNDAPHIYGGMLFNDFFDWLNYLSYIFRNKKIKCLIKIHPAQYDRNYKEILKFLKNNNQFKLLEKFSSHNEILENNNIKLVLTVYGSVAHEYSYFGIPVINAGRNPHVAYNFSYNPKTLKDYKKLIFKILEGNKKFVLKRNEIYEFYYMHFLDTFVFFNSQIGEKILNTKKIYEYFCSNNYCKKIDYYINKYQDFILSKNHKMVRN
jgi:hypothetical protein